MRDRTHGPLTPGELAEAAVLADLSAVLVVIGWIIPVGGIAQAAAAAPFAALAYRHRLRAVVIGSLAGSVVAMLVAGPGAAAGVAAAALFGFVIGYAARRGWSAEATVAFGVAVAWTLIAGLTVGVLSVLGGLRKLTLEQFDIAYRSVRNGAALVTPEAVIAQADHDIAWILAHWWFVFPALEAVLVVIALLITRAIARPGVARVQQALAPPRAGVAPDPREPGPVPVRLHSVRFRYPGADSDALCAMSLDIQPGTFVAVLGENGSGKSTLARILSGVAPTAGEVVRPGSAGLGLPGGTAMVFQRPESQVLGVRVGDDMAWGVSGSHDAEAVASALHAAGLDGFEERETATMSGGELQRLAVAAALVRRPKLLLSDESTSMLDPAGREELLGVLRGLRNDGITVVHVTHRLVEAHDADLVVVLRAGRVALIGPPREVLRSHEATVR